MHLVGVIAYKQKACEVYTLYHNMVIRSMNFEIYRFCNFMLLIRMVF